MRIVVEEDLPGQFVNPMPLVHKDPQVVHNGTFVTHRDKVLGLIRETRPPVRFSVTEAPFPGRHAPQLGEHSDEVLSGDLGLDTATIAKLRKEKVVL